MSKEEYQLLDEEMMVKKLGMEFFKTPREEFIKIPQGMTVSEYKKRRMRVKDA